MTLTIPDGSFDAYLFDCDGTLADTMPIHYEAWLAALEKYGAHFPEDLFYQLGGTPTGRIVELLNKRFGYSMPVEETHHAKEVFYLEKLSHVPPILPVIEWVDRFHGKIPLAVVSGGRFDVVCRTLDALHLRGKFDTIVTADQVSRGKPFPDSYLLAAERLKVQPERCLVFEDTELGAEAARAAGMPCVMVPPPDRVRDLLSAAPALDFHK